MRRARSGELAVSSRPLNDVLPPTAVTVLLHACFRYDSSMDTVPRLMTVQLALQ